MVGVPQNLDNALITWAKSEADHKVATAKVLAKETASFNIRVLTIVLGPFNTIIGDVLILGKSPVPDDYEGSVAEQMKRVLRSRGFLLGD